MFKFYLFLVTILISALACSLESSSSDVGTDEIRSIDKETREALVKETNMKDTNNAEVKDSKDVIAACEGLLRKKYGTAEIVFVKLLNADSCLFSVSEVKEKQASRRDLSLLGAGQSKLVEVRLQDGSIHETPRR